MGHQVPSPYNGSSGFIILKAALIDGCQVWLMFHAFKDAHSLPWVYLMEETDLELPICPGDHFLSS